MLSKVVSLIVWRLAILLIINASTVHCFLCGSSAAATNGGGGDAPALRRNIVVPLQAVPNHKMQDSPGGGILYKTSVFNKQELALIRQEMSWILSSSNNNNNNYKNLQPESSLSIAQHRLGYTLPRTSQTAQILANGSLLQLVHQYHHQIQQQQHTRCYSEFQLSSHLPIELRSYQLPGACMPWHVDDVLYSIPQVEFVWTLENTSNCVTMWKKQTDMNHALDTTTTTTIMTVETEPNSVLLIPAGGPWHCVSPLKRGKRVIIKGAYVQKDATFYENVHKNQFDSTDKNKKSRFDSTDKNKKSQNTRRRRK